MARHKATAKTSKGGKRGRPPAALKAAGENGVEKTADPAPKVAPAITKPKGKRGRPVGSTKKGKKRGAAAKALKKSTKKESESEHEMSGNDGESGADEMAQEDGAKEKEGDSE